MAGILYLVATPIGNLEDMTYRSVRILSEVDSVWAEDTRRASQLLSYFKIQKPLVSYHEHNERKREVELVEQIRGGNRIALITDAGTPGISDPGFRAVRTCIENDFEVVGIPGPCAAVLGLSVSGLPTDQFHFVGFLPSRSSACEKRLQELGSIPGTLVFYESPYRVIKTLSQLAALFPGRRVVAARELTKKFEEIRRGTALELLDHFKKHPPKGEFVMMMEGIGRNEIEPVEGDPEVE